MRPRAAGASSSSWPSRSLTSVLWPGLLKQDGGISKAPHAEGDRECRGLPRVALQLGLFDAAAAPPDLRRRQEAAGRLLDVHDAVCADAIGAQQPTQLDEEPMRVGVLLLLAALRTAAARLLFDDCSGWGGRGGLEC